MARAKLPRKNTNRVERINSLIQQLVGEIILPYLKTQKGITTISKVETSRDLHWAKIWITIVNDDDQKILATLKHNLYDIQGELNRLMQVKIVPKISFHLDTSARHAQHINELFNQIKNERESGESKSE